MKLIADVIIGLVAVLHLWFLVLEMFLWARPIGLKVFKQTLEKAKAQVNRMQGRKESASLHALMAEIESTLTLIGTPAALCEPAPRQPGGLVPCARDAA